MAENTAEERNSAAESGLTFPERHWLLLCILVAILSPLMVHWIQGTVDKKNYEQSLQRRTVQGGIGGSTPSGGAVPPGDTAQPGSVNPMASPSVQSNRSTDTVKYR